MEEEKVKLFIEKLDPRKEKFRYFKVFFPEGREDICIAQRDYTHTITKSHGPYGTLSFGVTLGYLVWLKDGKMNGSILSSGPGCAIRGNLHFSKFNKGLLHFDFCSGSTGMLDIEEIQHR